MNIEGCNPVLGCTILLSGPHKQREELYKVKHALKQMMSMARSIVLEKYFLEMLRIEVSSLPPLQINLSECPERETMHEAEY